MNVQLKPTARQADTLPTGWMTATKNWGLWPYTERALRESYYADGFPIADQQYALTGLQRFAQAWSAEHAHREIEQIYLDQACAHEVLFHHFRSRLFRRPCAALSTCWQAIVCERPERVLDRHARATIRAKNKAAKGK